MYRRRITISTVAALSLALAAAVPMAAHHDDTATDIMAASETIEVSGVEYAFVGLPMSVPAGTSLTFSNTGAELHEMAVARIADDTTESLEELLAMGDAAIEEGKVELIGEMPLFAGPYSPAEGAIPLERDGQYVAICFIPQGMTDASVFELMGPGMDPEALPEDVQALLANPPHVALGMIQPFEVTPAGTEVGPMPEAPADEAA